MTEDEGYGYDSYFYNSYEEDTKIYCDLTPRGKHNLLAVQKFLAERHGRKTSQSLAIEYCLNSFCKQIWMEKYIDPRIKIKLPPECSGGFNP